MTSNWNYKMGLVVKVLLVILIFCHPFCEGLLQVYVDPDLGQDNEFCLVANSTNVSCKSLDFAFSKMRNSTAYILKVPHRSYNLSTDISFRHMADLSFWGDGADIMCAKGVGIAFIHVIGIQLEGIAFRSCAATRNSSSRNFQPDSLSFLSDFDVSLYFLSCTDIAISNVVVRDSPNAAGVVMYDTGGKNVIENSLFANNSVYDNHAGGGGFYVEFTYCSPESQICSEDNAEDFTHVGVRFSEYNFTNVTFADNVAWGQHINASFLVPHGSYHESFGRGGGICLYLKGTAMFNNLTFNDCVFRNNTAQWGGGMMLEFHDDTLGNIVSFNNCTFTENRCNFTLKSGTGGGGMRLGHYVFEVTRHTPTNTLKNNMVLFQHCNFSRNFAMYGGGLSISPALQVIDDLKITPASVKIIAVTFEHNVAKFGSALYIHRQPSGITGKMLTLILEGTLFVNNSASYTNLLNTTNLAYTEGIGVIYINQFDLIFRGSAVFSNNSGSGIALAGSILNITNCNLTFQYNTGYRGGAIILLGSSSLLINNKTSAYFFSNLAKFSGGAIYVRYIEISTLLNCFIRHTNSFLQPGEWRARFTFVNNTDDNGRRGNSIHSTSVFPCAWTPGNGESPDINQLFCWSGWEYYKNTSMNSKIDNCSSQISTEIGSIEFLPNASSHMNVIPGHEQNLPFQVSDDYGNNLTNITVFSTTSNLTNETNPYFWGGTATITGSNVSLTLRSVSDTIWRTDLTVGLLQCPPGLYGEDCSCLKQEAYRGILSCDPISLKVTMEDQTWMGYFHDQYLIGLCPPGFCNQTSNSRIILPKNPNQLPEAVCAENRTGILCGQCVKGSGPAVNSRKYECVACPNSSLLTNVMKYVSVVYIPLTVLLAVLIIFDIRLTTGPANGFILFCQMVTTTFSLDADGQIPFNQITNYHYDVLDRFFFVPYGIFNLEFIENLLNPFCLTSSYSTLNILVLDYVVASFPLLIIIIITLCLKLKEFCCCKCPKLYRVLKVRVFKGSNISQALLPAFASFLLLSYHKFSLTSAYLQTSQQLINKDGDENITHGERVYFAGHIEWKSSSYTIMYFIPSMIISFILFVIAVFLLGYPLSFLEKCLSKVKPLWHHYPVDKVHVFLDTFHGCYKVKFRFFSGLYFLFRLIISVTYALSFRWITQFIVQQVICILIGALVSIFHPYRAKYLNYVDILIFADLAVLNTITIHLYYLSRHGQNPPTHLFALQYALKGLPLIYMMVYVFYVVVVKRLCNSNFKLLEKIIGRKKYTRMKNLVAEDKKAAQGGDYLRSQSTDEDLFLRAEEANQYCRARMTEPNSNSDYKSDNDTSSIRPSLETGYGTMKSGTEN